MNKSLILLPLFFSLIMSAQDTVRTDASLNAAIVYFGYGAELTHQSKVHISSNTRFIIINQLSTAIDINSLQISCPENVALLSHRYSIFYPKVEEPVKTKEMKLLEDSVAATLREISRAENLIITEQEILTKTGLLIEATVNNTGTKNLTSAEIVKLVEYYSAKIEKTKTSIYNRQQSNKLLAKKVEELTKQMAALYIPPTNKVKPYGQLLLQVLSQASGEIPVSLSYYTTNAGWTPSYDIRVNSKTNKVKLVYKAALTQTSGFDWKKVKLTLSTGTPNLGVTAPVLSPWYLQLYVPELYKALSGRAAGVSVNKIQSFNTNAQLSEVIVTGYSTNSDYRQESADKKEKEEEPTIDPSTLQQYTTLNEGQLNTNFEIDLPYDIDADGELHSVTIKDEEIDCILKNYAIPRIDKDPYLLAEVADWESLDLLPGDANIIMDDTYVGRSTIDPNTTADTLNLSLGRDKRIAVKRTLIKELSSLKTSGGNNKQSFTYETMVKNNKLTDVNLLLKDQYPLSTIKEVEVKLEDGGEGTINEETGIITWKITLKSGESRKVRISYTVKYPKGKKILNLK